MKELVRKFGAGSNSYLTLYPEFKVFRPAHGHEAGAIGYVNSKKFLIAAAEPFGSPSEQESLFKEFAKFAGQSGRGAAFLPVSEELSRQALRWGLGRAFVGLDSVIELSKYDPRPERLPIARQIFNRGARAYEFRPETLSYLRRAEIDELIAAWLNHKLMAPLSFIGRVSPWQGSEDKKYFYLEMNGKVLAMIAALPIWSRNAWYFMDVIRLPDAALGATELLILEAIRILKSQGASEVTLGLAPLSGLSKERDEGRPWLNRFLRFAYKNLNRMYHFEPLFEFKAKFGPTRFDRLYLVFSPPTLTLGLVVAITEVFSPEGLLFAVQDRSQRFFRKFSILKFIESWIKPTFVMRDRPHGLPAMVRRLRFTLIVFALNLLFYWATRSPSGALLANFLVSYGFTGAGLLHGHWSHLFTSGFIHTDSAHISINLLMLGIAGIVEIFAGTPYAIACYFIPQLLSNPITFFVLVAPLKLASPTLYYVTSRSTDVGASLGIFGLWGAMAHFLSFGWGIMILLTAAAVFLAIQQHDLNILNHIVALGLGYSISRVILSRDLRISQTD